MINVFFFYPQFIAEFDLRSVQYEVKSSRCHEMRLAAPPHDCISFNFRCDREAEEWATVVMSSLREAHRGELTALSEVLTCFTSSTVPLKGFSWISQAQRLHSAASSMSLAFIRFS